MPTLAIIDGIRIMMYLDDHPPPHVHAFMSGREAQFEILTGSQMEGELDRRSMRKVKLWIESNRTFLMEQWKKCQSNTSPTTTRS
jgi:hypothetical protein